MKLEPVDLRKIKIDDRFWNKHVRLVRDVILPYQWDAINDRIPDAQSSHCLDNFQIAAGRRKGTHYGEVFQDTDIAKWLEAVGFSLCSERDEELEKTADEVIDLIVQAQCPDGYLNTYFTVKAPDQRWHNLCEGHELYTAGHMIEAAVAYYMGTGKRKLLDCVIRFADLICKIFGEDGEIKGYPGHQEIELALVKLGRVTGNDKYLKMAKIFLDRRGVGENYFLKEMKTPGYQHLFPEFQSYDPCYSQSHQPVRMQRTAEGHAVRAVYMYSAMADVAWYFQDQELMEACEHLWNNIVNKRMYITGGIGSSGFMERFTCDYDLPNSFNYSETCASIGLAMFGLRMGNLTGDGKYFDVVERALYNTILAGVALDGKSFFYVNPLEVWPPSCMEKTARGHIKPVRQKWFGVACCPPNVARTLASLGQYILSYNEKEIYIHLFISSKSKVSINGEEVTVCLKTQFPWANELILSFENIPKGGLDVAIRIPDYVSDFCIMEGSATLAWCEKKQYAHILLKESCELRVSFQSPPHFIRANPRVRADVGKIALTKGPLVYCLEEADNGENLASVFVASDTEIKEKRLPELGDSIALCFCGKRQLQSTWDEEHLYRNQKPEWETVNLTAVPYAYWSNRGQGEMCVWMKELMSDTDIC